MPADSGIETQCKGSTRYRYPSKYLNLRHHPTAPAGFPHPCGIIGNTFYQSLEAIGDQATGAIRSTSIAGGGVISGSSPCA